MGRVILLLLATALGAFIVAGGRTGPSSLVAQEAPQVVTPFPITSPAGWPRGAIEHYDVDGLFEKINGKADAYIVFDVIDLTFAGYANPQDPSVYVDVYIYDMAEPLNAYGIYRVQRSGQEEAVDAGAEACRAGSAFFGRKGSHYVEVVGSAGSATTEARAVLGAVLDALPAAKEPVRDPAWFPDEGRTRILYARTNALGVESLGDAFLARYADGVRAAVARFASAEEAEAARAEAVETYEFLGTPAHFEAADKLVVGALGSKDPERLKALVAAILAKIKEGL
ncbi:MAG: hypothetical protein QNJ90_11830 [Planctomycetota bacterium]|nr:hypothetical protein [Planctomycetota bacterium]